jgi:hypothetical protein
MMSLFHRHEHEDEYDPADAASFEVLCADGTVRRYERSSFDGIFESTDADEVQRQVAHGWVILDEHEVESGRRGPSGDDLIVGIEGLRVGGMLGYQKGETATRYTVGYLKDDAQGEAVE